MSRFSSRLISAMMCLLVARASLAADRPMVDYINPIIGAGSTGGIKGKVFPGAATPFGLVQLSPDTITGGDNGAGYSYAHDTIEVSASPTCPAWAGMATWAIFS